MMAEPLRQMTSARLILHVRRILLVAITAISGCAATRPCVEVPGAPRCWLPGDELRCTLQAPATVNNGEPLPVRFTLTNTTARTTFQLLPVDTPLEGQILNDVFAVRRNGEAVEYRGVITEHAFVGADSLPTRTPIVQSNHRARCE